MITRQELVAHLEYDESTGVFYRKSVDKKGRKTKFDGKKAGRTSWSGHITISISGVRYAAHHLAWLWVYGVMPEYLDHKDLNPSNNRIGNLRMATHQQNCLNRPLRSDSQTGFKGVKRCPNGKFMVRIVIERERKYLGLFDQAEEAAKVYDAAARVHHGEFALLNFLD